jgi:hypothetical protein
MRMLYSFVKKCTTTISIAHQKDACQTEIIASIRQLS